MKPDHPFVSCKVAKSLPFFLRYIWCRNASGPDRCHHPGCGLREEEHE